MPTPYDDSAFYQTGYPYNWAAGKYAAATANPWGLNPATINPLTTPSLTSFGGATGQIQNAGNGMMTSMTSNGLSGLGAASVVATAAGTAQCHYNAGTSSHMYRNVSAAAASAVATSSGGGGTDGGSLNSLRQKAKLHASPYALGYSTVRDGKAYPSCQFGP